MRTKLVLMALLGLCWQGLACRSSSAGGTQSMVTIEAQGSGTWAVRVERKWKEHSAKGQVLVRQEQRPQAEGAAHQNLAGSRAWLALGQGRLAAKDTEGAIACGRAGLKELGPRYASPLAVDDTGLKVAAAEERIKGGHPEDGAQVLLRMLEIRNQLYVERNKKALAE